MDHGAMHIARARFRVKVTMLVAPLSSCMGVTTGMVTVVLTEGHITRVLMTQ